MYLIKPGENQLNIYPSMLNCCVSYPYWKARIKQKHREVNVDFPILATQTVNLLVSSIITFSFTVVDDSVLQDLPNSIVYYKDWEGTIDIYNVSDYDVDLDTLSCPCYSDVISKYVVNSTGTSHELNPFNC